MGNVKHTPGPWEVGRSYPKSGRGGGYHVEVKSDDGKIAMVGGSRKLDEPPESLVDNNARLIAAAPDLLEMCKQALNPQDHPNFWIDLKAAIAKAEGQEVE